MTTGWLAKGHASDVRARHEVRVYLLVLLCGGVVVVAFVLGLR